MKIKELKAFNVDAYIDILSNQSRQTLEDKKKFANQIQRYLELDGDYSEIRAADIFEFVKYWEPASSTVISAMHNLLVRSKNQKIKFFESRLELGLMSRKDLINSEILAILKRLQISIETLVGSCQPKGIEYNDNSIDDHEGGEDKYFHLADILSSIQFYQWLHQCEPVKDKFKQNYAQAVKICNDLLSKTDILITGGTCTNKSLLQAIIWYSEISTGFEKNEIKKQICNALGFHDSSSLKKESSRMKVGFNTISRYTSEIIIFDGVELIISKFKTRGQ